VLRVTVPTTFGRLLIAAWAGSFLGRYPNIKLEFCVTDRRVDLIREGFDIAVRIGELQDTNLIAARSVCCTIFLAHHPLLERRGTPRSIDDLKRHACLRYLLAAGRNLYARRWHTDHPDGPFDTDDAQYLIEARWREPGSRSSCASQLREICCWPPANRAAGTYRYSRRRFMSCTRSGASFRCARAVHRLPGGRDRRHLVHDVPTLGMSTSFMASAWRKDN